MTIICLIGPSGSGKTTLAEALVPTGIDTIRSYTTRPMRPGEQNGREHIFISEAEAHHLLTTRRPMAYTLFGGYRYFALWEQVVTLNPTNRGMSSHDGATVPEGSARGIITYVIDEAGYHALFAKGLSLHNELKRDYHIEMPNIKLLNIRIERSEEALAQTIDPDRRQRDQSREAYDGTIPYRIIIHNDAPTAADLTAWAQSQLAPAITTWLHYAPLTHGRVRTHLTTQMGIAEIIAALNGAIACGEAKKVKKLNS